MTQALKSDKKSSILHPPEHYLREAEKIIRRLAYRHSTYEVFADFIEMAAIAFRNSVDLLNREEREQRYLQIVKKYTKEEVQEFPKILGALTLCFEIGGFQDALGALFHSLELQNHRSGQFFTPYHVSHMMAKMTLEGALSPIEQQGFITVGEPACGAGAMIIACANTLDDMGINYQEHLHVTGTDVDIKCVQMAYIQCTLLHIPAVIIHGNSITLEAWDQWYTPAHILGFWSMRLKDREKRKEAPAAIVLPPPPRDENGQIIMFKEAAQNGVSQRRNPPSLRGGHGQMERHREASQATFPFRVLTQSKT